MTAFMKDVYDQFLDKALEGRRLEKAPEALEKQLTGLRSQRPDNLTLLRLAVRMGSADAYEQAVKRAGDAKAPEADEEAGEPEAREPA